MRQVKYKTYWAYASPGVKQEGTLLDLVLDILYLMDANGVIPPFHVLNERLQGGGDNGGMSPGTKWRPFKISEAEYQELVQALLLIDPKSEKAKHPYMCFDKVIIDEELNNSVDYHDWLKKVSQKYPKS